MVFFDIILQIDDFKVNLLSNLLTLIKFKNYNVANVKEEALLVIVHNLLGQYISAIEKGLDKPLIDNRNFDDEKIILNLASDIYKYLDEKIISSDIMDSIFNKSTKDSKYLSQAKLLEPIGYFYDILTRTYMNNSHLLEENEEGKQFWIPELLAFSLIIDMKEYNYNFKKFEYISKLDLHEIMTKYNEISIKLLKENKINSFINTQNKSPIKAIQSISLIMVKKLISSKYKTIKSNKTSKGKKKNARKK